MKNNKSTKVKWVRESDPKFSHLPFQFLPNFRRNHGFGLFLYWVSVLVSLYLWKIQVERCSLFNLAEVTDTPTRLSFKSDFTQNPSLKTDANKRRYSEIRRKSKGDEAEISQPSDDAKSAKQDEIIALFRRIQSSISKVDSLSTPPKRRGASNPSRDNYKPSTESVLEIFRQSRNQVKGEPLSKEEVNKVFNKKEILQKEEKEQENQLVTVSKINRPPSNFVKRSPIPSLSITREKVVQQSNAAAGTEIGTKRIEEMKVSELKELAKSKGIKGYSKLKKNEIIELIRSSGI